MPFIAEALWEQLPLRPGEQVVKTLAAATYPPATAWAEQRDLEAESAMEAATAAAAAVRALPLRRLNLKAEAHSFIIAGDELKGLVLVLTFVCAP